MACTVDCPRLLRIIQGGRIYAVRFGSNRRQAPLSGSLTPRDRMVCWFALQLVDREQQQTTHRQALADHLDTELSVLRPQLTSATEQLARAQAALVTSETECRVLGNQLEMAQRRIAQLEAAKAAAAQVSECRWVNRPFLMW